MLGGAGGSFVISRTLIFVQISQARHASSLSRSVTRRVLPWAAVHVQVLQTVQMAELRSTHTGVQVPFTTSAVQVGKGLDEAPLRGQIANIQWHWCAVLVHILQAGNAVECRRQVYDAFVVKAVATAVKVLETL